MSSDSASLTQSITGSLTQRIAGSDDVLKSFINANQRAGETTDEASIRLATQDDTQDNLKDYLERIGAEIKIMNNALKPKKTEKPPAAERVQQAAATDKKSAKAIEKVQKEAASVEKNSHGELPASKLLRVYMALQETGLSGAALREAQKQFKEPNLVAEAMRFVEDTLPEGTVKTRMVQAREEYEQENAREIEYGQVMSAQARDLARGTGQDVGFDIRQALEEIMHGDAAGGVVDLFNKLNAAHGSYQQALKVINHSLRQLGLGLKSTHAERPLIAAAVKGIRGCQAVMNVYQAAVTLRKNVAKQPDVATAA